MVGVLLVTHGSLGFHLLETLKAMLGELSLPTDCIEIRPDDEPDGCLQRLRRAATALDQGHGVILLTDAFGSTPSNLANAVAPEARWRVVSGLNLPMLVRIYNYPALELDAMIVSAVEAGRQGIFACTPPAGDGVVRG